MLGAIDAWFTGRLAGIQQRPGSVGYRELLIDPATVGDLTSAADSYTTPYGKVRTKWSRAGSTFRLEAAVPAGSTAEIHVPAGSGKVRADGDARLLRRENGTAVYEVGSGTWTFVSTTVPNGS
ncbi:alpha-L-rhamnosidase C-terminal domain-containing protein [Streptomyces sp. NPDC086077]|uniref:alpha-L-rhamnosidase C-terminal domain-containing protein n=1 Tax=Streptomyces sp. NPDC086077 TaxID=3154862 RepID=UPI00342738DC